MPRRRLRCKQRRTLRFEALEQRQLLATFSGTAFYDADGDRVLNEIERGIDGIKIDLFSSVDNRANFSDPLVATTWTDGEGRYSFSNLAPGFYFVEVDIQQGMRVLQPSSSFPFPLGQAFDVNGRSQAVFLTEDATLDVPMLSMHDTLRERVFHDLNGNHRFDAGEPRVTSGRVYHDHNNNGNLDGGETWTLVSSDGRAEVLGQPMLYAASREWSPGSQPLQQNILVASARKLREFTWAGEEISVIDIPLPAETPWVGSIAGIAVDRHGHVYVQQSFGNTHYISVLDRASGEWEHHATPGRDAYRLSIKDDYLYVGHGRYHLPTWTYESLEVPQPFSYTDIQVGYDGHRYAIYKGPTNGTFASIAIAVLASDRPEVLRYIPVIHAIDPPTGLYSFTVNPSGEIFLAKGEGMLYRISPEGVVEDGYYAAASVGLLAGADNSLISASNGSAFSTFDFVEAKAHLVNGGGVTPTIVAFAQYQHDLPIIPDVVTITPAPSDIVVERGFFVREPEATADEYLIIGYDDSFVSAADGVLRNDFDEDGDALLASLLVPPEHGTLELLSDGSFRYTAEAGFEGEDRFVYSARDHWWGIDEAEVVLRVRSQVPAGNLSGLVWRDTNANQVQDNDEALLAGIPVLLDDNRNGVADPGERTTLTDATGRYVFAGVLPGEHAIKIMDQPIWEQTFPRGSTNLLVGQGRYVHEYTRDGTLVESLLVEFPEDLPRASLPRIDSIKTDNRGRLHLRQGNYVSTYDFESRAWSHIEIIIPNHYQGGDVGQFGINEDTIFLGEGIRLSLETGEQEYFPFVTKLGNHHAFHFGHDGKLYAWLSGRLAEIDPEMLVVKDLFTEAAGMSLTWITDVEVGPHGDIWMSYNGNDPLHLSRELDLLNTLSINPSQGTSDLALSRDGWLASGKVNGVTYIVSGSGEVVASMPHRNTAIEGSRYTSVAWKAFPDAAYDSHLVTVSEGEGIVDLNFGVRRETMPPAAPREYEMDEDAVLNVNAASGLLGGVSSSLAHVIDATAVTGTLHWQPDGSFSYVPSPNFSGNVTFTYTVSDGVETASAIVAIDVRAVPEPWHNASRPNDADGDGQVTPVDALYIINFLNASGPRQLDPFTPPDATTPFYDVSGDNFISPLDALLVINALNAGAQSEVPAAQQTALQAIDPGMVDWFLTSDDRDEVDTDGDAVSTVWWLSQ